MAPLLQLVIQILLGSTPTEKLLSPEGTHIQKADQVVKPLSPLLRSSISLSSISWGFNRLDVYASGLSDKDIQHKYWDGYQWGPSVKELESLGGYTESPPVAVSWGPDRNDIFTNGGDGGIYHKYWDGSGWKPSENDWENLGGKLTWSYALAVTSWASNRLDVFGVGPDGEDQNALWHKYWDGSAWKPDGDKLEHLGGNFISEPAVVSWGPDRIDVFAVDRKRNLLHRYWDGSDWISWEILGTKFASTPTAVSWGKDRLDVFGVLTNGTLFHKYWDGSQWSGWEDFGGNFDAAVAVTSWGVNRLDIVGLGDSQYHYKYWDGSQWNPSVSSWYPKNGSFYSAPSLVSWAENRLDIFGVGSDNELTHQTWYGTGWWPSSTTWETLGGPLQSF